MRPDRSTRRTSLRNRLVAALGSTALVAAAATAAAPAGAAPSAVSNDPLASQQWALTKVGAPAAWTRTTGRDVLIGIVDTGVDLTHEDLAGQIAATADCVGSQGDPAACHTGSGAGQDDNGHGTHVSGIVAAVRDNGKGVTGLAPNAKLVVAKALAADGSGNTDDINSGIRWVVDHGAKVVNLSLGGDVIITSIVGSPLSDGIEYAWSHGAVPVLASGNTPALGFGSANYGSAHALVVGATGPDDEVAGYSSPTGDAQWALMAPGGDGQDSTGQPTCQDTQSLRCVVSTYWRSDKPNTYATDQGTSMAAPYVSGALALLMAAGLSQPQAVDRVLATVDKRVSCGANSRNCHGRLDVEAATDGLSPAPASTTTQPAPTSVPTTAAAGGTSQPAPAPPSTGGTAIPPSGPAASTTAPAVSTSAPAVATTLAPSNPLGPVVGTAVGSAVGASNGANASPGLQSAAPVRSSTGGGTPWLPLSLATVCLVGVAVVVGRGAWQLTRRGAPPGPAAPG